MILLFESYKFLEQDLFYWHYTTSTIELYFQLRNAQNTVLLGTEIMAAFFVSNFPDNNAKTLKITQ
jgi:hypothetical protein